MADKKIEVARQAGVLGWCVFVDGMWDTEIHPTKTWQEAEKLAKKEYPGEKIIVVREESVEIDAALEHLSETKKDEERIEPNINETIELLGGTAVVLDEAHPKIAGFSLIKLLKSLNVQVTKVGDDELEIGDEKIRVKILESVALNEELPVLTEGITTELNNVMVGKKVLSVEIWQNELEIQMPGGKQVRVRIANEKLDIQVVNV